MNELGRLCLELTIQRGIIRATRSPFGPAPLTFRCSDSQARRSNHLFYIEDSNPLFLYKIKKQAMGLLFFMAEREGFEPSIRDKPYTPLAGERLQPTRPSLQIVILD